MKMNSYMTVNYELAKDMLIQMPENKRESLKKGLLRNLILTSAYLFPVGTFSVYKEGFYLRLVGCRCNFAVWATDNDGKFEFERKPIENKLHKLYDQSLYFDESFFRIF